MADLAIIHDLKKFLSLFILIAKGKYFVLEVNRPYIWRIYHPKRYIQFRFETARCINDLIILIIQFFTVFHDVLILSLCLWELFYCQHRTSIGRFLGFYLHNFKIFIYLDFTNDTNYCFSNLSKKAYLRSTFDLVIHNLEYWRFHGILLSI